MDEKIQAMLNAKCAVLGCEEKQFMFISMPTNNPNISRGYPFCENHCNMIMERKISTLKLKDGSVYAQHDNMCRHAKARPVG